MMMLQLSVERVVPFWMSSYGRIKEGDSIFRQFVLLMSLWVLVLFLKRKSISLWGCVMCGRPYLIHNLN